MKNWAVIPAMISLLRAHFDRRAGRIARAKARIEEIQSKYPDMFEFLDAYYGFILIIERDVEEAERFFRKKKYALPCVKTDDQRYIELYCDYFLETGSGEFDWATLIDEANRLKPDGLTKRLLVLPTKEQLISALNA